MLYNKPGFADPNTRKNDMNHLDQAPLRIDRRIVGMPVFEQLPRHFMNIMNNLACDTMAELEAKIWLVLGHYEIQIYEEYITK